MDKTIEISAFKLTIIGAIVVLVLSVGLIGVLGGDWKSAAPYITLVGTIGIPALMSLARSEANAKKAEIVANSVANLEQQTETRHAENVENIEALRAELRKGGSE